MSQTVLSSPLLACPASRRPRIHAHASSIQHSYERGAAGPCPSISRVCSNSHQCGSPNLGLLRPVSLSKFQYSCRARSPVVCGSQGGGSGGSGPTEPNNGADTTLVLIIGALALAGTATAAYPFLVEPLEDIVYSNQFSGDGIFGPADAVAGVLWGASLFYASPLQQLLLFLGKIETQRPSDFIILVIAQRVLGMTNVVDIVDAPAWLSYVAAAVCVASGMAISAALGAGLGDSIWALSTGTGACLAAGVYELGRPTRLDKQQQDKLDDTWKDFVVFANSRLQRSGRCHESEVGAAFRREAAAYRSQAVLPDSVLRDLIRNYHPGADRTPNGYYRNLSLVPARQPAGRREAGPEADDAVRVPAAAAAAGTARPAEDVSAATAATGSVGGDAQQT